jgi:hypothetical protein
MKIKAFKWVLELKVTESTEYRGLCDALAKNIENKD